MMTFTPHDFDEVTQQLNGEEQSESLVQGNRTIASGPVSTVPVSGVLVSVTVPVSGSPVSGSPPESATPESATR